MTTPTPRSTTRTLRAVAAAVLLLLAASACSDSSGDIALEEPKSVFEEVAEAGAASAEASERTTTSLGLTAEDFEAATDEDADLGDAPTGPMAFVDEDRIEVSSDDPAIEPFVFYADELTTGESIDGLDLYKGRPTLMVFSVPTCPVCAAEAPAIVGAAEKYPGIQFVMVHSQGTTEAYESFVADAGFVEADNVTHLVDDDLELWRRFGVIQQPTSILIDADGRVSLSRGALAAEGLDIVAAMLELREPPTFDHLSPERPTNPDA